MVVNTSNMIPLSQVNRDFNRISRLIEYQGYAVILKHNNPKYLVLGFENIEEALEGLGFDLDNNRFKNVLTKR